jgi:hypothetical protein
MKTGRKYLKPSQNRNEPQVAGQAHFDDSAGEWREGMRPL